MGEFLNKLYNYEYFGIYLIVTIIILVLFFIIILFFGKKDQKKREIEATKKLQQINEDAFKNESIATPVEISSEKLENDTIIVPSIENIQEENNNTSLDEIPEPVLPKNDIVNETANVVDMPIVEPVINIDSSLNNENINNSIEESPKILEEQRVEPIKTQMPILDRVEEKPIVFNELNIEEPIVDKMPEVPPIIPEIKPIEKELVNTEENIDVPAFNLNEVIKSVEETKEEPIEAPTFNKGPEIFSSVYVPPKKDESVELPKSDIPVLNCFT